MSIFQAPPEPETPLGRMRILSPRCGLRVSPLVLGAMSIGEAWGDFMGTSTASWTRLDLIYGPGSMNKEQSFALLDAYVHSGGNWIDTAGNYQNEVSCDPKRHVVSLMVATGIGGVDWWVDIMSGRSRGDLCGRRMDGSPQESRRDGHRHEVHNCESAFGCGLHLTLFAVLPQQAWPYRKLQKQLWRKPSQEHDAWSGRLSPQAPNDLHRYPLASLVRLPWRCFCAQLVCVGGTGPLPCKSIRTSQESATDAF
jgi:hypothetical protein